MRLGAFPFCHYPVNEALPQYLCPLFTWKYLLASFSRIKTENSGSENCAMPGEKFWPEFKVLSNSDWIVLTKSNWTERSTEVFLYPISFPVNPPKPKQILQSRVLCMQLQYVQMFNSFPHYISQNVFCSKTCNEKLTILQRFLQCSFQLPQRLYTYFSN